MKIISLHRLALIFIIKLSDLYHQFDFSTDDITSIKNQEFYYIFLNGKSLTGITLTGKSNNTNQKHPLS